MRKERNKTRTFSARDLDLVNDTSRFTAPPTSRSGWDGRVARSNANSTTRLGEYKGNCSMRAIGNLDGTKVTPAVW